MNYKKLIKYLPWAPAAYWASTKIALPTITKAKQIPLVNKVGEKLGATKVGKAGNAISTIAALEIADEVIGLARKVPVIKTISDKALKLAAIPQAGFITAITTSLDPTGHVSKFVNKVRENVNPLVNSIASKAGLENIANWAETADKYSIQLSRSWSMHDNTPTPKF